MLSYGSNSLDSIVALLREGIHGDGGLDGFRQKGQGDISLLEIVGGPYPG